MTTNIVTDWLRFLDLEEYSAGFLENGYDDLETVKLIELADLVAIGVMRRDHQEYLLSSVRILKERGAAWVYLIFSGSSQNTMDLSTEEKLEPNTTYYGSDGSSCLHSDSTYSSTPVLQDSVYSTSTSDRAKHPAGLSQQFTDLPSSKRFLLSVEVTPEHRQGRGSVGRSTITRRERTQLSPVRMEDDILTEETYSVGQHRAGRRSIFSQLGQWLCQGSPSDSLSVNDPSLLHYRTEGSPVISLPAHDVQYSLHYTPLTLAGRRQDSLGRTSGTSGRAHLGGKHLKLWTPLGRRASDMK